MAFTGSRAHSSRAGRRRKRGQRRSPETIDEETAAGPSHRRRRGRALAEPRAAVPPSPRWRRDAPITCHSCAHLVVTRSFVKTVGQSWDRAVIYPTLSCFEQRWTLEDPDSTEETRSTSPYLLENADQCPDFKRGGSRDRAWQSDWRPE
ncbi:MAG: hypothetical protein ACYDAG_10600 [Chloroflexota bacterium]